MLGMRIRLLLVLTAGFLMVSVASATRIVAIHAATFKRADLGHRFLLQVSYEQKSGQDFRTSRSRVVTFRRDGAVLQMLDVSDSRTSALNHLFATFPIRDEDRDTLYLDLNEGFDTVHSEEDRTGEDYYGRIDKHDETTFHLFERKAVSVSYHDALTAVGPGFLIEHQHRVLVGDG